MTMVWLGALFVIAGVVYMAAQPLWRGRLSSPGASRPGQAADTLEPARPAGGFSLKSNWPGLALVVGGAVLLLAGAVR